MVSCSLQADIIQLWCVVGRSLPRQIARLASHSWPGANGNQKAHWVARFVCCAASREARDAAKTGHLAGNRGSLKQTTL